MQPPPTERNSLYDRLGCTSRTVKFSSLLPPTGMERFSTRPVGIKYVIGGYSISASPGNTRKGFKSGG